MSRFTHPDANRVENFEHFNLAMPAFLFWCFRCLTGWNYFDQIDGFNTYPWKALRFILRAGYPNERKFGGHPSEALRLGILDYLFILPAVIKISLHALFAVMNNPKSWSARYFLLAAVILSYTVLFPLTILNYLVGLAVVLTFSPFLIGIRLRQVSLWNECVKALDSLELYVAPEQDDQLNSSLVELYQDSPELLGKKIIKTFAMPLFKIQFIPSYTHNRRILFTCRFFDDYSWRELGLLMPHQGNKDQVKAILHLGLVKVAPTKAMISQIHQQLTQMEPKKQFDMLFLLRQACRLATQDASGGLNLFSNNDVPAVLFNDEIARFVGVPALNAQELKTNNMLHEHFLKKGTLFHDGPVEEKKGEGPSVSLLIV